MAGLGREVCRGRQSAVKVVGLDAHVSDGDNVRHARAFPLVERRRFGFSLNLPRPAWTTRPSAFFDSL